MTAFDYSRSVATAKSLLARFGQLGAIRRLASSGPAHDPTLTPTDSEATLVVLDYTNREVDGTLVLATDRKIYVSTDAVAIEPTTADQIGINGQFLAGMASGGGFDAGFDAGFDVGTDAGAFQGEMLNIVDVKPLNPAGTVVYWEVHCRS